MRKWSGYTPRQAHSASTATSAVTPAQIIPQLVAGLAGEAFGRLQDPELELACVQAYNDWLIEEWCAASERFVPQCIVPIWPAEATVAEIKRAVAKGHR